MESPKSDAVSSTRGSILQMAPHSQTSPVKRTAVAPVASSCYSSSPANSPSTPSSASLSAKTVEKQQQASHGPRAMALATSKNRQRKGSLRKVILNRGALQGRRGDPRLGLTIDLIQSHFRGLASPAKVSGAANTNANTMINASANAPSPEGVPESIVGREYSTMSSGGGSGYGLGIGEPTSPGSTGSGSGGIEIGLGLPAGSIAAAQAQAQQSLTSPVSVSSVGDGRGVEGGGRTGGLLSPSVIDSTTDEDDVCPLQLRSHHHGKSPLSFSTAGSPGVFHTQPSSGDWDYGETEWWGWVVLLSTWFIFVIGMGSCLGVWSWAWDVGTTPYAPPELEDDPTLPITGYYPALIILSGVMAWIWVLVAWVGMKHFRHAKVTGD